MGKIEKDEHLEKFHFEIMRNYEQMANRYETSEY